MASAAPRRRKAAIRSATVAALLAASVGSVVLLDLVVRSAAIGDSDGATVVLEGQTMSAGHLLLPAWSLSLDSFWSVDAIFYAVAVHFFGVRGDLIFLVPAVIGAVVILVAGTMAMDRRITLAAGAGALATISVLALPSRAFAVYFVEGPFHVGTALWCLLAFALLARNSFDWRWFLAVVLLAAGLLGDFQMVVLGEAPILATALVATWCARKWRAALPLAAAALASAALAYVVRRIVVALGTFTIAPANPFASGSQLIHNFVNIPKFLEALFGMTGAFGSSGIPAAFEVVNIARAVLVLGGPLFVFVMICGRAWSARKTPTNPTRSELLSSLVCFAFIASLITFVIFPIITTPAYARYLNGAMIFGALLGGRVITIAAAERSEKFVRSMSAAVVVIVSLFAVGFAFELRGPRPVQPATQLANFLEANHLRQGVGAYWSAAITTVESRGQVRVRPVIEHGTQLVRYAKNSDSGWYAGAQFNYVVYNALAPWGGVSKKSAIATWGRPSTAYVIGPYRVLVYAHPFTVSVVGWTGGT
ncbi:MAG TPA: hypothetical protein VIJ34_07080 [Acidimicrobiales bacterium]